LIINIIYGEKAKKVLLIIYKIELYITGMKR
jgi:hypothetical protein